MVKKSECSLKAKCLRVLSGYPTVPPQRCEECTDLVKFNVETIPDVKPADEVDIWRGDLYNGN